MANESAIDESQVRKCYTLDLNQVTKQSSKCGIHIVVKMERCMIESDVQIVVHRIWGHEWAYGQQVLSFHEKLHRQPAIKEDALIVIYTRRQAGADDPLLPLEEGAPSITPPVRTVVLPPS